MTFPISLTLTGRRVLVVGGGPVGRRRAVAAADAGAAVTVVAPHTPPGGFAHPGVGWRAEPYHPDQLAGTTLVFAAAPAEVNAVVVADARAAGIWVCDAADPDRGDFTTPAVARAGRLTLAVDTGGASPSLARRIKTRLEGEYDSSYGTWVEVLGAVRAVILAEIPASAARRRLLDGFADWAWLDRSRAEGPDAVRAAMLAEVERVARGG